MKKPFDTFALYSHLMIIAVFAYFIFSMLEQNSMMKVAAAITIGSSVGVIIGFCKRKKTES